MGGGPADEESLPRRVEENVEFGRYTLKEKLAAGGMGVVYVAEDRKLKRTVALKMIRGSTFADDGEVARFTLEAEAAAALDHPHIVPIYEVGRLDGQPFFTMKLIEGQTLAQRLRDHGGTLPAREVAALLAKIARAVHHAHQRGVLHRDLKPGNILLDAEGVPWLTDFGLAKVAHADSSLTLTKDHIGTPHYMAPEVAGGNARAVSTACDVWALGVMLWEMLCAVPPFHGPGPVEIMRRIVESEPGWPAGSRADGDLVTIARRCMEKNPARRPQSAGEVADELERWLRGEPIKARPVTRGERFLKWVRREPAMAALYAVLTLALFTGLYLWKRAEHAVISLSETNERIEQGLRIATATKLAGDARLQVEENPSRALMLAVESIEMMEPSGVLPESASALTDVLQRTGGLDATAGGLQAEYSEAWLTTNRAYQEAMQASPDSRWLLTLDFSEAGKKGIRAAVFDLRDRERAAPLRRWTLVQPDAGKVPGITWKWMDDARRITVAGHDGQAAVWHVISPQMERGQEEPLPPVPQPRGSFAGASGAEIHDLRLHCAGQGDAPVVVCGYREPAGPQRYQVSLRRLVLRPDGLEAGPRKVLDGLSVAGTVADLLPDTKHAIIRFFRDPGPALLMNMAAPDEPPVILSGMSLAYDLAMTPDGRRAVVRDLEESLHLFDLPEPGRGGVREVPGRRLPYVPGNQETLNFSPDGKWLAVAGNSGTVTVMPLQSGGPPVSLPMGSRSLHLCFSPNSRWLAAGSVLRTVHLWNLDALAHNKEAVILRGMPTSISAVSFAPDGQHVFAIGGGSAARRWPFDSVSGSAQPRHYQAGSGHVQDIAVSPDQQWIAAACRDTGGAGAKGQEGYVTLSRLDGRGYLIAGAHADRACAVAFSRNGRWLVSTGYDDTVKVWDFPALQQHLAAGGRGPVDPLFTFPLGVRTMHRFSVTFHPGDGCLYQVNSDGKLFAWDLSFDDPQAHRQEQRIHSNGYALPDVTVSPDGRWLAVARHAWDVPVPGSPQHGNQVLLYEVGTYSWPPRFVTSLKAGFIEETNLTFSPDSRWLAAGSDGHGPSIWDLHAANIPASRLTAPTSSQNSMAVGFSPDGRRLAYGGLDGMLHLWDWRQPADLRTISTGAIITTLAWLQDGRLATAGGSSKISLWDTDIPRLKALARRVAGRNLSETERARFRVQKP